ncbi:unnamed protein product [Mytilus coruscus]|uniref:DUF4371 domain-containing protein n=1 Tax=Mytilus coruscus TaxID=42192 RepID=A0A6J8C5K8_MYTCO|nr:unnamed protein product [Mytilus coruscus]
MCAQGYDGAANMSGIHKGVQSRIKERIPGASNVLCKAHNLNLSIVHASEQPLIRNLMNTVQAIACAFDYSAEIDLFLKENLEQNAVVREEMDRPFKVILVVDSLENLEQHGDLKARSYACSIKKYDFIITLVVAQSILQPLVPLSEMLERKSVDLIEDVSESRVFIEQLNRKRDSLEAWDELFEKAVQLADTVEEVSNLPRGADRQRHRVKEPAEAPNRLCTLNPINIVTRELCLFIDMSEKYPAMILRKLISEYCTFKKVTIEDIVRNEKHELYHKRIKTESCCKCSTQQSSTFIKVIPEKQWDALYEISKCSNSHSCPSDLTKCSERFVPKTTNTSDLSVIMTLLLYSENMMHYIVSRLFANKFCKFLMENQHTFYHSMDKKRCCKCSTVPTEKILINKEEWNKLFLKENDILCKINTKDCCCQYSVRRRIKYSDIDDTVLFKFVYLAGPIGVLNKIKEDAFLYFINWTVDVYPLRRALTELLNIIEDKTFRSDMLRRTSSVNLSQSDETEAKCNDAYEWVSKHIRKQKATTKPPLQMLVRDKDGLCVRSVQIPQDFTLPHRTRKITDITSEENNFLVVVHGLSKIVYPIVINEFNTHCRHHMLSAIRKDIFEQYCKSPNYEEHKSQRKRMYLSQKQQKQLFSPRKEESNIVDLKLMIYILKENTNEEEKKYNFEQLDVIDEIRRQIVQSSSGILNEIQFQDIMERICKAVLYLGGERYLEELLSLQRIQNILGQWNLNLLFKFISIYFMERKL